MKAARLLPICVSWCVLAVLPGCMAPQVASD